MTNAERAKLLAVVCDWLEEQGEWPLETIAELRALARWFEGTQEIFRRMERSVLDRFNREIAEASEAANRSRDPFTLIPHAQQFVSYAQQFVYPHRLPDEANGPGPRHES